MPEAKEPVILSPEKIPQHADDTDVLVDKIIGMVKGYSPNANTDMIYVAYKLAKSAHSHQFRRSGAPYIEHPVQLAYIAAQLSLDATAISAALLHDVVEDTPYTYENIETIFGKSVAELVDGHHGGKTEKTAKFYLIAGLLANGRNHAHSSRKLKKNVSCNGKGYTRCYNKANRQTAQYAYIELYAACKTAFNFKRNA